MRLLKSIFYPSFLLKNPSFKNIIKVYYYYRRCGYV
jgi:hypothetical protein